MRLVAFLSLAVLAATSMHAGCAGQNLITALPPDQRAALQAAADAVPYARGNLWQATKEAQVVTLIGTYHLDDPRHAASLARLAGPLAAAATLLVEASPAEEAALRADIAQNPDRLANSAGPALREALSEEDWLRLSDALRSRGIAPVFAAQMQPWYLSSLLAIPPCQFTDTTQEVGLDKQVMAMATARALPIAALEPYDTVFGIFDSFTTPEQVTMLVQSLDASEVDDDMAITLSDSYFSGQSRLFWEYTRLQLMTLSGATQAEADRQVAMLEKAMITRRNRAWLPVITAAAARGPVVAAFGALHLSGQHGVLNLLAAEGWVVLPLSP
jgi:uncharacterized protein YbaP (TraB family)